VLVNEQQLAEINNQLTLARGRTAEAKSRFEQIQRLQKSGTDVAAIAEVVQSNTITALRSQYAEIARRAAELMTQLGPRHPSVGDIQAQAQGLRRLIAEEVNRVVQAVRNEYERARASEESLVRTLEGLKRNALSTNEALVALRELEREVQTSRAVYESFLTRARETGELELVDTKNVRVISPADAPLRRSWPPSFLILALGAVMLGVAGGGGLAFLRDNAAGTAVVPAEVSIAGVPVIAAVRESDLAKRLLAFNDPGSRFAAEIRRLHEALRAAGPGVGQSVLLLAPHDDVATSAVALNLAAVAAMKERVLVIDADVARRTISALSRERPDGGLVDVALDRMPLADAVVRDHETRVNLMPLVSPTSRRHRKITTDDIRAAFDRTRRFDLVVVAARGDVRDPGALMFAGLVDHVVPIVKRDDMFQRDLAGVVMALGAEARKIRGTVTVSAQSLAA
jgi:Mrp family chromosome partitioning ATPase